MVAPADFPNAWVRLLSKAVVVATARFPRSMKVLKEDENWSVRSKVSLITPIYTAPPFLIASSSFDSFVISADINNRSRSGRFITSCGENTVVAQHSLHQLHIQGIFRNQFFASSSISSRSSSLSTMSLSSLILRTRRLYSPMVSIRPGTSSGSTVL